MANSNIFGELYANTYDVIYSSKNYVQECDLLEQLFKNKISVDSVLDLGCGTGGHAAELSMRGYQIVGLDQSMQMIKIAQDKNLPNCDFRQGDICTFDINQTFDAVYLMFNVIGYLSDEHSLLALRSSQSSSPVRAKSFRKAKPLPAVPWHNVEPFRSGPALQMSSPASSITASRSGLRSQGGSHASDVSPRLRLWEALDRHAAHRLRETRPGIRPR